MTEPADDEGKDDRKAKETHGKKEKTTTGKAKAEEGAGPRFSAFVKAWCGQQGLVMPRLHIEMASWLDEAWTRKSGPKRLLLLAFRGAGKSTLVGLFAAWLLARNPDLRILTLSADLALARKMVRNVKQLIESLPGLPVLKPKRPDLWGSEQFTLVRPSILRDPSMLARGIDGNITGSRADIVICDDVEVPGNSDNPAKRRALRDKLGEVEFILVPGGMQLYLGTPHSYYSIYADAARPETGEERPFLDGFARRLFAVVDAEGKPRWSARFSAQRIEAARRAAGPLKFASQMMLTPVAPSAARLEAAKLLRYAGEVEHREAHGRASLWLEGRKLASLRVWWDPAFGRTDRSSRNVVAAVYQDEGGGFWVHRVRYFGHDAALAAKCPETEAEADQLCRTAARFAHDLAAPAITVEDNGIGKLVPGLLRKALAAIDPGIAVIAQHSRRPKDERILSAFDGALAAGLLHAHESVCDGPFAQEMAEWRPGGKSGVHDDALDAVAGAILAEPTRLGTYPRAPSPHGDWRSGGRLHQAETAFDP